MRLKIHITSIPLLLIAGLGAGCENTTVDPNATVEKPVEASAHEKDMLDTPEAEWSVYTNADVGIQFVYPQTYGSPQTELVDNESSQANDLFSGKKVAVYFEQNDGSRGPVYFAAYTPDYAGFKENPFHGVEPLARTCPDQLTFQENGDVCLLKEYGAQEAIFKNMFSVDEGSFAFNTAIEMKNPAENEFTGLRFSTRLADTNADIEKFWNVSAGQDSIEASHTEAKEASQRIVSGDGLSAADTIKLEEIEKMAQSLKRLDS